MNDKVQEALATIIQLAAIFIFTGLLWLGGEVISKKKISFSHIGCAVLFAGILAFVGLVISTPKSGFFSFTNKTIDPLRTSKTFGKYNHPLLDRTYFHKSEMMHDLERLAEEELPDLQSVLKDHRNPAYALEMFRQRQALVNAYKKEKEERQAASLYTLPVFGAFLGGLAGLVLNEHIFKIRGSLVPILVTVAGVILFVVIVFIAEMYRSHVA